MSSTLIVSVIAGLIVLSIIVSAISYNRQQVLAKRKRKLQKHKDNATEMLNYAHVLSMVDEKYTLLKLVQGQAVTELKCAYDLMPEEQSLKRSYHREKNILEGYQNNQREHSVQKHLNSNTELNNAKQQLLKLKKFLDILQNQQSLSKSKASDLNTYISHLMLELEVNSHIYQARQFGEQKDMVMYQLHIKQARDILKKSSLEIKNKNERIKQLTDVLNEVKKTNKVVDFD